MSNSSRPADRRPFGCDRTSPAPAGDASAAAREGRGSYDAGPPEDEDQPAVGGGDAAGGTVAGDAAEVADRQHVPFGLPVLAEIPQLAVLLERVAAADGAMLEAVAVLADLLHTDTVETTTGSGSSTGWPRWRR